ncbi:hypothetical protein GIB67_033425 [Kingdonia uniflora]|uniref:Uncharacterized protein n=1 Tax=Kingdonia uniflora TaxID=39325 RepID=A0A7J7LTQ9_9MAGN|nr:hypothetical protein GIB67_033425 [Kingdonia uniflora]
MQPFFGMFGYGGAIASMHLGRHALVSSKTKESGKVYMLHLKKEALMSDSGEKTWKTDGGIRDQLDEEISLSPHGSFTKCDELVATGKTSTPVEFQVNNMDLAEFEDGEVATTNLLSCNGPEFVFQLYFSTKQDTTTKSTGSRVSHKANARLKCVYFPLVEGKESIAKILESLDDDRLEVDENFDTFCRVSIRRLGRLLPDARWGRLPFMEPRQKKGGKAQLMKRCCSRVKCFVETDAGFNPNPYKVCLVHFI